MDLDRHLFAWTPRRRQRRKPRPTLAAMGHRLGARLVAIRAHWRAHDRYMIDHVIAP
jgi:hypothetical protein